MIKSLRSLRTLPEYKQLSRSIKRLTRCTVLNAVSDGNYDLDLIRREIRDGQDLLTRTIMEGSKQYKKWADHSKLRVYTVVTHYDYEDDNIFSYYCIEGDHSEDHRAYGCQVIITDRKLPEEDHNSKSLDALCGEWMSRDLYQYIKLTSENF